MKQNAHKKQKHIAVKIGAMILAAFMIATPPSASAQDITSNLIGHWTLDETSGTTVADSASSNNGTMNGGLNASSNSVGGIVENALIFDGTDDYINLGNNYLPALNSLPATISAWVNVSGNSGIFTLDDITLADDGTDNNRRGIKLAIGSELRAIYYPCNTGGADCRRDYRADNSYPEFNKWAHVAAVLTNGTDVKLYINGIEQAGTFTGNVPASPTALARTSSRQSSIGRHLSYHSVTRYADGAIDDVRIYDRALSAADITELYNVTNIYKCSAPDAVTGAITYNDDKNVMQVCNGSDWQAIGTVPSSVSAPLPTAGLVAHWQMDETGGTLAADTTGSYNGVMSGGLNGTDTIAGQVATALNFNGSSDYIDVNTQVITALPMTYSSCIYFDSFTNSAHNPIFLSSDNGSTTYCGVQISSWGASGGTVGGLNVHSGTCAGSGSTNRTSMNYGYPFQTGQWYHLAVVFNAYNDTDTYINGIKQTQSSTTGTGAFIGFNPAYETRIGSPPPNYTAYHDGRMDDVRIYNRALSEEEVLRLSGDAGSLGLVGHWKLDETSGTTITDSAGSNNGTMSGGLSFDNDTTAGIKDSALQFDGVDDGAATPYTPGSVGTVSMWFKPDTTMNSSTPDVEILGAHSGGARNVLFRKDWGIGSNINGPHCSDNGAIDFIISPSGGNYSVNCTTTTTWNAGQWYFLTASWNGSTQKIYVNGALERSITQTQTGGWGTIQIASGSPDDFDGTVDDIRAYDRMLTDAEVAALYSTPSNCPAPEDNLVAHWKLDETTGTTFADATGNGNTGTAAGGLDPASDSITGKDGTAIDFDGVDDGITISTISFTDTEPWTLSAWLFDSHSGADGNWIGRKGVANYFAIRSIGYQYRDSSSILRTYVNSTNRPAYQNKWVHHTYVSDGAGTISVYFDGAYLTTIPNISDSALILQSIGHAYYNANNPAQVDIDDVRLYDRALNATEVALLYGGTGGTCTGPEYCTSPDAPERSILYNDSDNVMQYCNGDDWVALGPAGNGGGGCTSPTGAAGDMVYNETFNVLQYCEGDEWVATIAATIPADPLSGLAGHWKLDETSGTSVTDSAGSNNGTMVGFNAASATAPGQIGTAMTFDNSNDAITLSNIASTTQTLSAWVKPTSRAAGVSPDYVDAILWKNLDGVNGFFGIAIHGDGYFFSRIENSGGAVFCTTSSSPDIPLNQWTHVGAVQDGPNDTVKVYINGQLIRTCAVSNVTTNTDTWYIGRQNGSNSYYFHGGIDDVRIYNRTLSDAEMGAIYANGQ